MKRKQVGLIIFGIVIGIAILFFVHNDAFLYSSPIGRIESVTNGKRVPQEDNFHNQDFQTKQNLTIKILNGQYKGQKIKVQNTFSLSQAMDVEYQKNQQVILNLRGSKGKVTGALIQDIKRDTIITFMLLVVIGLLLLMKSTGIYAILSLALNSVLFYLAVVLDVSRQGFGVLYIFGALSVIFAALTLSLVLGRNRKMLVTFLATIGGTTSALIISLIVFAVTGQQGLHFETMEYVTQNPEPLFLAETILGSLGAVMDESTDIVVSLSKIIKESPSMSVGQITKSANNIGKNIMGPLINVLFMIFMTDTFSMMALFLRNGNSWGYSFEMNMGLGMVQSLISGIGIVLAIPLAGWLASVLLRTKGGLQHV